uniref:Uncharacterized protein n=1 Tax=Sphaerodactylus townsendi TaxID=933632 RepID=A0ACB8G4W0_9SAUR
MLTKPVSSFQALTEVDLSLPTPERVRRSTREEDQGAISHHRVPVPLVDAGELHEGSPVEATKEGVDEGATSGEGKVVEEHLCRDGIWHHPLLPSEDQLQQAPEDSICPLHGSMGSDHGSFNGSPPGPSPTSAALPPELPSEPQPHWHTALGAEG